MSYQAVTWALEQDTGCPVLKCILLALAHHADINTWDCWPLMEQIAKKTCVSKRSVQRHITKLAEAGFIDIIEQYKPNGGRDRNRYVIKNGKPVVIYPPGQIVTGGEVTDTVTGVVTLLSPPKEESLQESKREKKTAPKAPAAPLYGEAFERLWLAYERYGHKKKAAEAFNKLEPEMQEQIIAAVPRYLASRGKDRIGRFVTYNLENFLRGEIYARHATPESVKRVEPTPPAPRDRNAWSIHLEQWRKFERWPAFLGPEPGFPGSLVPEDMLQHGEQEEADEHVLKILNWMPEHERRECEAGLRRIPSWLETRAKISAAARMGPACAVDSGRAPCGLLPGLSAGGSGGAGEEIRTGSEPC